MHKYRLSIKTQQLDWNTLLFGHGWIFLLPNEPCPSGDALIRSERLPNGELVRLRLSYDGKVRISGSSTKQLSKANRGHIHDVCTRMLRLNEDYSTFHALCDSEDHLAFVSQKRAGGLLRSPTVYEDTVKTILTTNCSWKNTKAMVAALCSMAEGSFPTPAELISFGTERLKSEAKVGYRADFIHNLSVRICRGDIDPESWIDSPYSEDVEQQIDSIRGVGTYAANHILMLLGRYDRIPIDSEIRKWIRTTHFNGNSITDSQLLDRYKRFGKWQYLAFKFDRIARRDNYIN